MGEPRATPRRRAHRFGAVTAILLSLSGGIVLSVHSSQVAYAQDPLTNEVLENTPITHSPFLFHGTADPGDPITVSSPVSQDCHTVADALGNWTCDVVFTESADVTTVTASRPDDGTPAQDSEGWEYPVALPVTVDENAPGQVVTNGSVISGAGAWPTATMDVTIDGSPCIGGPADPAGAWSCTYAGPPLADGSYPIVARQAVGAAISDATNSSYVLDTVVAIPDFSYPYDTSGPGDHETTSDQTPEVGGDAGDAEPFGTVRVYADDQLGVVPGWPPVPSDPGTPYCDAIADASGAWSCTGAAPLPIGSVWVFGATQDDLAGNATASPDAEFSLEIIPPPPSPTIVQPVIGYTSENQQVHVETTNLPEGTVHVREGATDLCPPTPVAVATFSCDTIPLAPGPHTISVYQEDTHGTLSAPAQRLVTILAPPAPPAPTPTPPALPLQTLDFTFRIVDANGAEVGEDGLSAGDQVTIVSEGLPTGTEISAEIHSTPVALGTTTIGSAGLLKLPVTVPEVEPGDHEVVISALAPGYERAVVSSPVRVREVKQIPDVIDEEDGKQLGEREHDSSGAGVAMGIGAGGFGDPSEFGQSLESPFDPAAHAFQLSPAGIVLTGSIAVAFLLLVGFPAELLESTIRSNYDRAFGWLARLRRRLGRMPAPVARAFTHPWWGTALTVLAASVILGFADPGFGFTGASLRLLLAMILAVSVINIGLSLIVMRFARRAFDVAAVLQPMPAALVIVALSVIVSRLAGISPGFLFGVVLGVAYARELRLRDDARLGVLGFGLTIAAGLLAWLGYGLATAGMSGHGFLNNLVIETLAAITLEALGTLIVALLPIEFLDGRTIFRWSKAAWAGLYALTAVVFVFVVVPLSDNWGTMSAPILGWGTLFAVFAVVAVATWAVFRRKAATSSSPEAAAPRRRSQR